MSSEGGLDGKLGGLQVPYLSHQDDIRVLTQDMPQAPGEGQTDLRVDGLLDDPMELILYRVL